MRLRRGRSAPVYFSLPPLDSSVLWIEETGVNLTSGSWTWFHSDLLRRLAFWRPEALHSSTGRSWWHTVRIAVVNMPMQWLNVLNAELA